MLYDVLLLFSGLGPKAVSGRPVTKEHRREACDRVCRLGEHGLPMGPRTVSHQIVAGSDLNKAWG